MADIFEGVDLLTTNSDDLAKSIGSGYIKDNDIVEISAIDAGNKKQLF